MTERASRYTIERPMLVMIGACLLVIACTISLLAVGQKNDREEQIRARGIGLVRLLAGLPNAESVDVRAYQSMLQLVSLSSRDFAYAVLVSPSGTPLAEVTSPGVIVPAARLPQEPSSWIGEHGVELPDGRAIMEYYVPVFASTEVAGHIRLGFYEPTYALLYEQVPIAATLALLIFLLTPLLYYLLRREIRPLVEASASLETALRDNGPQHITIGATPSLASFVERFNRFIDQAQRRIHELESERGELVSSAKLISYKKARIDMILQTLPDGVLVLDEHGRVTYANERVSALLGASKEDVLSKAPAEWCKHAEIANFLGRYETNAATRYATDPLRVQAFDENKNAKTLAVTAYPLFSPKDTSEIHGTLVTIRDVTDETLAQAGRMEFVAHLGHELKTPLNTLALSSEMLLDMDKDDDKERVAVANTIHDEVGRLVGLVNNLMSITRIEIGALELDKQRVRLADLIEDIRVSLGRTAEQNGMRLEVKIPRDLDAIMVDKDLLRIAINNLVSNAIKYSERGGTVKIDVVDTNDSVLIHVADTGLGISREDRERIFEKFYRSERADVRLRAGHGLGLPLARDIVAMHGGEISVESELGAGSTFTISLWKRYGLIKKAV